MDIDFDDLDGPSKAPVTKAGKFAPKNSKFKPAAKPKREQKLSVPLPESNPVTIPKVELDDSKPPQQEPPSIDSIYSKTEMDQPLHTDPTSHDANGSVKMDADATEMEIDNEQEPDDGDRVVREIDVFITSSVDADSKVYVLQYPLRQSWRPYELEERCEKVRVKPETAEVEVEMSVQVDSENFDADADDKAMSKQVLSSSWKPPPANGYAVGILVGNELHLNPVHAVVQLRPSMQHLQHPSKKMNATRDEDMIDSADIKSEKAIKQPKKQSKPPGPVNEQNENTKEQWIPLKYHGAASELSDTYIGKMVAQPTSQIQFSMSPSDYIDSLCPATSNDKLRSKGPSRSSLLKLPLEERYKTWLSEGPPVHRFTALKHLAPNDNDADIFRVLQSHAQLVQGLWVAKSKLKYKKDVGKEVLLRNYVLLQFSKNPLFNEMQLPKIPSFSETIKGILDEFATRRDSCRDWKFKECPDVSFIKDYPDVVQAQKNIWDLVEPQINEFIFRQSSKHSIGDRRATSNSTNDVVPKTTNVPPSRTPMLDEAREALPKALQKVFQAYKVCSLNQIRQRLRDMAVSENTHRKGTREARAAAAAADAPQEELQKTLNQVAVNIHGSFVSRSSPDHPQYDELRNIVINLFLAEGPKGRLKKASIYAAASVKLNREITNVEYQKVLNELCISQNSAWILKSGDSPT
ncbi:DNA-directed RNA polymerase III subunit RPC5 isoform X2 [Cynara cardunculus var. scolymus]|nr:DNA-directed RNA polymerase III subunit RPC5 isoform X2 [Cynara cardunculus var. scolymus]